MNRVIDQIDEHFKDELLSGGRLASFVKSESYQLLFFRGLKPGVDEIDYELFCILFKDNQKYLYDAEKKDFIEANQAELVSSTLRNLNSKNKEIIETFSSEIEDLEEGLYSRSFPKHFIDLWFDLRNELSKIERYSHRLIEAVQEFSSDSKFVEKTGEDHSFDILAGLQFNHSKIKDELSRLDTLHHYYLSIKSDRQNRSLYILTILSGIFLPLNLVVGFFGMNTENLFFKGQDSGTIYVIYILLSTVAILLFFIPLFKLLDRFILNFFLGRINLYKKLNERFDKISETFKVD